MTDIPSLTIPEPLLKPEETAELLSISPRTLWTLTKKGEIPCVRVGRAVRYDPPDLRINIESQKQSGKSNS